MSKYEKAVDSYNQKIDRLRTELELASEETLGDLSCLPMLPDMERTAFEEFIYEVTHELAAAKGVDPNTEEFEVCEDLSRALYLLDQIADAASKEIERRDDELRGSEEYQIAMDYLDVIQANTHPNWTAAHDQLQQRFDENVADLAISDAKDE